jgi:predicted secreted protein
VITTVSVTKQDSGQKVHLNTGDILEVSLVEREPTAAWKVQVDEDVIGLLSQSAGESVWLLGESEQRSVRQFRAKKEGRTTLQLLYQRIGDTGITTLDTFTLDVTVGTPPVEARERERLPLPEIVFILMEVSVYSAAFFFIAFSFSVYAGQPQEEPNMKNVMLGLTGSVMAGAVGLFCLLRLVHVLIDRFWRRE